MIAVEGSSVTIIEFKFERYVRKHIVLCTQECDWYCKVGKFCVYRQVQPTREDKRFISLMHYFYQQKYPHCDLFKNDFSDPIDQNKKNLIAGE